MTVPEKKIMLGNEAIARGAYEAGVKVSSAYPGTPSTEISESLAKYPEVYAEWAPNEKVATEVALGASVAGVRSLCCMKHVGVNVASDPLYTAAYTGVRGGMVLVAADDPGMYSSQNEQDTRMVARAAMIPVLEPSDSQEAKDFVKYAYALSEAYDTPVILRSTTRLSHSRGPVELRDREERPDIPYEKDIAKYVMMPGNAIRRHVAVEARLKRMAEDANGFPVNRVEYGDLSVGFITSGIAYQYVKEAMPRASVLKLGILNPLPRRLIEEFAAKVDRLYVFEELEPVVEEQVKSWGISKAVGKEIFTRQGEYSANLIRERVLGEKIEADAPAAVPARPPILCPGCPHRSVFTALKRLRLHATGDIGCYTLGAVPPLGVIETTVCMGSGISMLHGIEKARGGDFVRDWVAVIGDSTFLHTGVNSLMNMAYNQATGTVVILDNSTTAMTGHQDHAATGKTLKGQTVPAVDLMELCRALGVKYVFEADALDQAELEAVLRRETAREALSVIVARSPCALLKGVKFPYKCAVDSEKCRKCGACLKPGCPALTRSADGTAAVEETMCNGCGLCMQLCKFGAIEKKRAGE